MTAPTDTFIDNFVGGAQRTQEAVTSALTDAVRTWTDTVLRHRRWPAHAA